MSRSRHTTTTKLFPYSTLFRSLSLPLRLRGECRHGTLSAFNEAHLAYRSEERRVGKEWRCRSTRPYEKEQGSRSRRESAIAIRRSRKVRAYCRRGLIWDVLESL